MMALAFGESQAIHVDAAFIRHKNERPAQAGPFIMAVEAALLLGGNLFQLGGTHDIAIEPGFLGAGAVGHDHQL